MGVKPQVKPVAEFSTSTGIRPAEQQDEDKTAQ